jgi:hypothetical protein
MGKLCGFNFERTHRTRGRNRSGGRPISAPLPVASVFPRWAQTPRPVAVDKTPSRFKATPSPRRNAPAKLISSARSRCYRKLQPTTGYWSTRSLRLSPPGDCAGAAGLCRCADDGVAADQASRGNGSDSVSSAGFADVSPLPGSWLPCRLPCWSSASGSPVWPESAAAIVATVVSPSGTGDNPLSHR